MSSVLITGASSGIGAATARHLHGRGFRVFGTSRSVASADRDSGVEWIVMDVCDEDSVRKGVAEVLAATPRLDALVCNAGYGIFGSVEEVTIEHAQQQLDTNFFGVLRTLRAVLPHMRDAGAGRIAIVGSLSGRAPIPFQAHYSASKAAVDNLALALRNEVRPHGIHVSLVEPGDIDTPFNDAMSWGEGSGSPYGERIRRCEQVVRESLAKAPGPEHVARAIERALTARRPRVRYTVGADSILVPVGRRLLPDWLTLSLIRSHFKI
ncbi:MAG: SDR family oxidoreductase [Proteobacteria bacterium]|nr:SDR family oxidoreductase [Pseudomonadota bacterium]